MNLLKKIKIFALLIAAFCFTGCGSQMNIGYVDSEKVFEAPQIKAIIEEGQKKADEVQQEVDNQFRDNPDMPEGERNEAMAKMQMKLFGIAQAYETQVKYKYDEVLAAISKEKKLDVVIYSSENQPIISKGGIDITDEVIKKLQ